MASVTTNAGSTPWNHRSAREFLGRQRRRQRRAGVDGPAVGRRPDPVHPAGSCQRTGASLPNYRSRPFPQEDQHQRGQQDQKEQVRENPFHVRLYRQQAPLPRGGWTGDGHPPPFYPLSRFIQTYEKTKSSYEDSLSKAAETKSSYEESKSSHSDSLSSYEKTLSSYEESFSKVVEIKSSYEESKTSHNESHSLCEETLSSYEESVFRSGFSR